MLHPGISGGGNLAPGGAFPMGQSSYVANGRTYTNILGAGALVFAGAVSAISASLGVVAPGAILHSFILQLRYNLPIASFDADGDISGKIYFGLLVNAVQSGLTMTAQSVNFETPGMIVQASFKNDAPLIYPGTVATALTVQGISASVLTTVATFQANILISAPL